MTSSGTSRQGFVPAMVAREITLRNNVFSTAYWRNFFIVCFCLGFSALLRVDRMVGGAVVRRGG